MALTTEDFVEVLSKHVEITPEGWAGLIGNDIENARRACSKYFWVEVSTLDNDSYPLKKP